MGTGKGGECILVLATPLILEKIVNVDDPNEWIYSEDEVREYVSKNPQLKGVRSGDQN